jgi:hypothetical protein
VIFFPCVIFFVFPPVLNPLPSHPILKFKVIRKIENKEKYEDGRKWRDSPKTSREWKYLRGKQGLRELKKNTHATK